MLFFCFALSLIRFHEGCQASKPPHICVTGSWSPILSGIGTSETKANLVSMLRMDEGRKRVLAIVAGILVARHLKTGDDLFDTRDSPRTRSMVAAAVQWAERIMKKVEVAPTTMTRIMACITANSAMSWPETLLLAVASLL